jgi:hypothetical protein
MFIADRCENGLDLDKGSVLTRERDKVHDPVLNHHPCEPAEAVSGSEINW